MSDEIDRSCPKCACCRSTQTGVTNFFGTTVEKRRCDFCRHQFRVTQPKDPSMQTAKAAAYDHDASAAVAYHSEAVRCSCPYCQSRNPPVTKTMPAVDGLLVRYHKCGCGRTFHSEERQ